MELNKNMYMHCWDSNGRRGCGAVGHVRRDCPVNPCINCGKAGHVVDDCPTAKPLKKQPPNPPGPLLYAAMNPKRRRTKRDV